MKAPWLFAAPAALVAPPDGALPPCITLGTCCAYPFAFGMDILGKPPYIF